jgi:hypothetical protein
MAPLDASGVVDQRARLRDRAGVLRRALFCLLLTTSCLDAAVAPTPPPPPPRVHVGGCTIVWKFWLDDADHSKGALLISFRPENPDDCPDELTLIWDDER